MQNKSLLIRTRVDTRFVNLYNKKGYPFGYPNTILIKNLDYFLMNFLVMVPFAESILIK